MNHHQIKKKKIKLIITDKYKFLPLNRPDNLLIYLGSAIFESLIFKNTPGKNLKLFLSSSAIKKYFKTFEKNYKEFEHAKNGDYSLRLSLEFRKCIVGEIYRTVIEM